MAVPSSGQLRLYADIGVELGVTQSNVSLGTMSNSVGFTDPDAMSEFYGWPPATTTTTAAPTTTTTTTQIPAGTLLSTYCSGTTKIGRYADGSGGTYDQAIEYDSVDCGYVTPAGTLLSTYCDGTTKMGTYANGSGGSYNQVIEYNSTECGYVYPAGTLLSTFCFGYDLFGEYADGSGGTYTDLIETNSTSCGYSAPTTTTTTAAPTTTTTTAAPTTTTTTAAPTTTTTTAAPTTTTTTAAPASVTQGGITASETNGSTTDNQCFEFLAFTAYYEGDFVTDATKIDGRWFVDSGGSNPFDGDFKWYGVGTTSDFAATYQVQLSNGGIVVAQRTAC